MDLHEAINAANQTNTDVCVRVSDSVFGPERTCVMAETRTPDGQKYAAWDTYEDPEKMVARLVEQARTEAAAHTGA